MAALAGMIAARVPVAVSLGLVGVAGYAAIEGWAKAALVLGNAPLDLASAYDLSVVPLFALMGALSTTAGLSGDLFRAANAIFAGLRGSLAMAAIGASAAFGAVCGTSLATAATMSRVSIPEMLRAGYHPRLAAGAVAAGGTLGILVPPSLILVIYALITQQSVARLFAAALLPGILLTVLYVAVVFIVRWARPSWTPGLGASESHPLSAVLRVWHVAFLFLLTIGGLYLGWFSPTEAAAVGAFGALALGFALRKLDLRGVRQCLLETIDLTAALFLIVMGSKLFTYFVVQSRVSSSFVQWVEGLGWPPGSVILLVIALYVILGFFLEGLGMVLVTVPIVYPVVVAHGFDPVWFGVLLVIVVEIGLIHPPMGMNLFVIRAQNPEISIGDIYLGVLPFLVAPFVLIAMILAYPGIALWLPELLYGRP